MNQSNASSQSESSKFIENEHQLTRIGMRNNYLQDIEDQSSENRSSSQSEPSEDEKQMENQGNFGSLYNIKAGLANRTTVRRSSAVDLDMLRQNFNSGSSINNNLSILAKLKNKDSMQKSHKNFKSIANEEADYKYYEDADSENLNSFLSTSIFTNKFQISWSVLLFLAHTYHMLTFWFYAGIKAFPRNELLALQVFFEFVLLADFGLRLGIKIFTPGIWESVWLLHDYYSVSTKLGICVNLLASIPVMTIIVLSTTDSAILTSFGVAMLRMPKLMRFREINKMFNIYLRVDQDKARSFLSAFRVAYSVLIATHIIGWIWVITGRIDPDQDNWMVMDNFDQNPSDFQKYIEACFFTVSTMGGLGFGNVIPTTDLEYFVVLIIMITGSSIYANLFANFSVAWNERNAKRIDSIKKLDQAKNFCNQLNIDDAIMRKIRYFYCELSIKYGDLWECYLNLKELPTSLATELAVNLLGRRNTAKKIELFWMSDPMFVLSVSRLLFPKMWMAGDYVIEVGDIAEEMFFINTGLVEIQATDNATAIAYLGEGSYFGEIGILLTGTRTVSVKAKTICIFYTIGKDDFLEILNRFPEEKDFLLDVGRQRIETTNPEDLVDEEEKSAKFLIENQILLNEIEGRERLFDNDGKFSKMKSIANLSMQLKEYKKRQNKRLPCNLTQHYPIMDRFIIIPFSYLYYIWMVVIMLACAYNVFMVPFSISLQYNLDTWLIPFDLLSLIIFGVDIFITAKTAFNKNFEIIIDQEMILVDYMDTRFFLDICAILPVDYILWIFSANQQVIAFWRLLRFLKLYKPIDYIRAWRKHSNVRIALFTILMHSFLFVIISHLFGWGFFYIGRHEVGHSRRYDGQSLFENTISRSYLTLEPVMEMPIIEQYIHNVYLATCTMGAVMYGDMIPLTLREQMLEFLAMFVTRIFLAFLYAEAASYLSSIHSAYSNNIRVRTILLKYLELNNLPIEMKNRVHKYHDILWVNFKGMNQNEILNDLPSSIQKQIKYSLFGDLLKKVTLFPSDDKAAISALVSRLDLQLISKGEFVIRDGEIADCMYFVLMGSVNIIKNDVTLATLEQGAHFGEMALAARKPTIRTASALCMTNVSVGSLSIKHFNIICSSYPDFEAKIDEEVIKRKTDFDEKTKNIVRKHELTKSMNFGPYIKKQLEIKESRASGSKRGSIRTDNKGSRAGVYKLHEPEAEDNPERTNISQMHQTHTTRKKGRNSQMMNTSIHKLNDSNVNLNLKGEDEDLLPPINTARAVANLIQGADEEENESDGKSSSREKSIKHSIHLLENPSESSHFSIPHNGNTEVKTGKQRCILIFRLLKELTWMRAFKAILFWISLYNTIFIPLQAGFQIDYSAGFIVMEVFTLLIYGLDIVFTILKHKEITITLNNNGLNSDENKLWKSIDKEKKDLKITKLLLVVSIISWIPFSIFFWGINVEDPLLVIFYIKLLRLIKIMPIFNFFNLFKQRALNMTRIVETLFFYYVACHIISWSIIWIAYTQPDIRDTWLRRLPVLVRSGMRTQEGFEGLSDSSIYIHALDWSANTVSHVAVGEISMVNSNERIYNAFIILWGTFIYAFLFGNVISIMADFAPQMFFFKFHKQYEEVMSSLDEDYVPNSLVDKIKDYFDYVWTNSKGISYKELLNELPRWLNADILSAKYAEAIRNSIIFKKENGDIDEGLTNSLLTVLEYRIYMDGDFIVIGGSTSQNTYILLDGGAYVVSLNEEFMACIESGGYFSNDLEEDDEDVYEYKRPLHIVSSGISMIGILNREHLADLYTAYPDFQIKLKSLNKNFINYAKRFWKKYLTSTGQEYNSQNILKYIADHYSYSTTVVYDSVRQKCKVFDLKEDEKKKFNIIVKQVESSVQTLTSKRRSTIRDRSSIDFINDRIFNEEEPPITWFSKFQFKNDSGKRRLIELVHLLNLLYIAITIPLYIGFDVKMEWYLILLELFSLFLSTTRIVINLRTPIIMKGGTTLELKKIISFYYHNGLILDVIALWPLNLILGAADVINPIWVISPLRLVRIISVWKMMHILGKFELYYKKYNLLMHAIKAVIFFALVCHIVGWFWFWFNYFAESDADETWMDYNELRNTALYRKVLVSYYTVINVVATVGSGDMFPMNDAERLFFVFLINSGDAIFAVGFGLIAGISMQASNNRNTEEFFKKMDSIKRLLKQNDGDKNLKIKVEQYFAYSWYLHSSTNKVSIKSLSTQLPYRLSKEVIYYSTRHLLEPIFKQFGSENLIKDVSTVLHQNIYLPGDFIIIKDDIGDEMYFIVEGVVYILAEDKVTVLNTLKKGAFFGEMVIFLGLNKRTAYVQAETFCTILTLKKSDLDRIKVNYPTVAEDIKKEAEKRARETNEIVKANKEQD